MPSFYDGEGSGHLDGDSLLTSLFISSIGVVLFVYGKRQGRVPHIAIGITLVAYTYFLSNILWMLVIAAALLTLLWLVVRLGW